MIKHITRPSNPYSPDWHTYWKLNPNLHRGVGAEAAEDLSGEYEGGDGETGSKEQSEGTQIADWASSIEDEGLRGTLGKYESQEKALEAIGYTPVEKDWREDLPEELRKTADRFTSKEDAIRAIVNLQKREGQVRVPGKDAKEEEIKAYHKAIGVPEEPDGYEWPDLGEDATEEQLASRDAWNKILHAENVPAKTAATLAAFLKEETERAQQAQDEADKHFAQKQEDLLRSEWKGDDYEKNKQYANKAFGELANRAGLNLEELTRIETKDGRFLMDNSFMMKLFAPLGREMSESTIGSTLTAGQIETIQSQIDEVTAKMEAAQAEGNTKLANKYYEEQMALYAKRDGNKNIVGSGGRLA